MDYASTNVRLPREQLKRLKHRAVEEGKSMGQVLREALERALDQPEGVPQEPSHRRLKKGNPFASITGLGDSGIADGGLRHDQYLYGKSK